MGSYEHDDFFDTLYFKYKAQKEKLIPIVARCTLRFRKFFALPYCLYRNVDWNECPKSILLVFVDFLYIFFKLKYYPENYGYCRLWEKDRDEWRFYFGSNYDAHQRYRLEKEVQKRQYQIVFEDKEVCQKLCEASGLYIPEVLGIIDPKDDAGLKISSFMAENNRIERAIVKPVRGSAGQGILSVQRQNGTIVIKNKNINVSPEAVSINERCLVQRFINQDKRLLKISPSTSIRFITLLTKSNDVFIISAEFLTASGDSYLSNWSAGGIQIGIDLETGRLFDLGFDKDGHKYKYHPFSNIKFADFIIPDWQEIKRFAEKIQKAFPFYKLLGPDITLSEGRPILYEINAIPDIASTEQTYGPLLKNRKIYEEFKKYNLVFNKI